MRITHCDAIVTCPGRNFVLVKVETDAGLAGWGDATLNGREMAVAAYVNEHLSPLLIGEDPLRIEHLWQSLYIGAYWRGGPVQNSALAGVDMALWDIFGKHAGLPVHQLLGGRVRDHALAYANASAPTPEAIVERARALMADGFKAVRVQLEGAGGGSGYNERIVVPPVEGLPRVGQWEPADYLMSIPPLFEHLRGALGEQVELLHDVHHRLTVTQAAWLARRIEEHRLFFLEDPFGPEYAQGLAHLRAVSATPIALGELFFDVAAALPCITNRWIDYLRCDIGHIGGITAARKLAAIAEPFGVRTAWHGPPDLGPIGHAANVQVDLAVANFGIQEYQPWGLYIGARHREAMSEIFRGGVIVRDGSLDVPDAPGLGIEVHEAAARKHPYRRAYLPVVRRADGSVHPW